MQHLEEGTIHAWLDGALDAEETARVEQHLAECATCASAVAEARGLVAGASRILSALDDLPSNVVPRSGGSLGGGGAVGQRRPRSLWTFLHLTPARAAAAAFLIVAAGTALVFRDASDVAHENVYLTKGPAVARSAKLVVPATPMPKSAADTVAASGAEGNSSRSRMAPREEAQPAPAPQPVVARAVPAPPREIAEKQADVAAPDSTAVKDAISKAAVRVTATDRFDVPRRAQPQLETAVVTGVVGGAAKAAAPTPARAFASAATPVGYTGCYSVAALGDSLGSLPRLLSLDSSRVGDEPLAAGRLNQTLALFAVSAITDLGRRPIDSASWQPLTDGVRISFGRRPFRLARATDSTLSAAGVAGRGISVTMQKVDCPRR